MVECAALEMRFTGNRNVGSNPTLSAMTLLTGYPVWIFLTASLGTDPAEEVATGHGHSCPLLLT